MTSLAVNAISVYFSRVLLYGTDPSVQTLLAVFLHDLDLVETRLPRWVEHEVSHKEELHLTTLLHRDRPKALPNVLPGVLLFPRYSCNS
jgi:hypothetical protein